MISKHGTKGKIYPNGTICYGVENHRPEYIGSGRVFGDLYDHNGEFHRTAIVADCGDYGRALRYCKEKNENPPQP